jgi:peroxiredoxin
MNAGNKSLPTGDWRRRSFIGGVGLLAAVLGSLWSWRRQVPTVPSSAAVESQALWLLTLRSPQGESMPMSAFQGRPLLLNFWATWCSPCVEELPRLADFYRHQMPNGWQILGLALDQPGQVLRFLKQAPLPYPVAMAGLEGADLSKGWGNESGSLPFSVLIHSDGRILERKIGQLTSEDLVRWAHSRVL